MSDTYQSFIAHYGESKPASRTSLSELGLESDAMLTEFVQETGGGAFQNGFVSIASSRERVANLGGWEHWLPEGAQIFGSSALGMFFAKCPNSLWLIDCEHGQVVESDFAISEFINLLVEPDIREDYLRESIFQAWRRGERELEDRNVLSPTPAIALAGSWDVGSLSIVSIDVYLSLTAQLFGPNSDTPADVLRNE